MSCRQIVAFGDGGIGSADAYLPTRQPPSLGRFSVTS